MDVNSSRDRPEARSKVGTANARRAREGAEWERTHEKPDPEVFTRDILPHFRM